MIELLLNAENALALGLLDQAERTYRTVLEADPRNGIAAVGLSRVALERGDETGAHALARAALEIDPENATARRMIDRLDEVARYRGAAAVPAVAAPADRAADGAAVPAVAAPADGPADAPEAPRAAPPFDPPVDDPQAMIRASGILGVEPEDLSGACASCGEPDLAGHEHAEIDRGTVGSSPAASGAPRPPALSVAEQESLPQGQQPGAGAGSGSPGSQPAAVSQPAAGDGAAAPAEAVPARPGLLRRILRRS